jgi:hypothetical protein
VIVVSRPALTTMIPEWIVVTSRTVPPVPPV